MDMMAILALLTKGIALIPVLIQAEQDVAPAIKVLLDLIEGAKAGTVTDDQLTSSEATLDGLINNFNLPL